MSTSVLLEAPQFKSTQTPLKSAHLSSSSYVLSIAALAGHYAASASAPANTIDIFDKTTLQGIVTLSGHDVAITSLQAVENIAGLFGRSLMSSGRDGSVKIWDPRSNSDPRQPAAPLRTHGSTHSDDVTSVSFARADSGMPRNTLLSASSDGLVSTSNADEADEDEAVLHVGNWGCSISQASWIPTSSGGAKIWAASDMETFSTWTHELDLCQSLDIRSPVLHGRRTWVTDYFIGCTRVPNSPEDLGVFVGGDLSLLSNANLSVSDAPWYLHKTWSQGHVGIIRSLLWEHENNVLVTGGEDAKINVWPSLSLEAQLDDRAMDVDMNPRKRSYDRDDEQEGKRAKR
ncbi:hypothetical protein C0992_005562 [Termitomyces sp. T32_za158]|nr:hypothetical protein C0992_005562 [Termitomyces sp. T32_za158]